MKISEPLVTKNIHGAYVVSTIINNHFVSRSYMGYTKREAVRLFKSEVRKLK